MVELAGIIILGILAQWIAWRLKLPAILPLILIGLFVGPLSTLFTENGDKLIEPIWNGEQGLFPGQSLFYFVSLAIGIILFEGGLTLKIDEIKGIGGSIGKLISIGSLITFIGGGLAAHYLVELSWSLSFLFSGLIIVTGPTVIAPILRNIPLKPAISNILKWEGILIDPIGALVAVLVFEFINAGGGGDGHFTQHALAEFGKIVVVGGAFGFSFAYLLYYFIKFKWVPHYLLNVFVLALVLGAFILSDMFVHESGLLTVVVMGMVLGNLDLKNLDEILYFKESLSVLLISILFILLSANINITDLQLLLDWRPITLFFVVILVLRPASVFASTAGSSLTINDKAFISWVGPRGIVAAGIASLFGLKLVQKGIPGAEYITPLVFMIVLGTVLLNATTAKLVGKALGVVLAKSTGIMIVGASKASRVIADYLRQNNQKVVLVDSNPNNIELGEKLGVTGIKANIYSDNISDNIELNDIGVILAMTGNADVNKYALDKFKANYGENGAYRLVTEEEMKDPGLNPAEGLFSLQDDFINLSNVSRDHPVFNETLLKNKEQFSETLRLINALKQSIPLFIKRGDEILILPSNPEKLNITEGDILIYMGKKLPDVAVAVV